MILRAAGYSKEKPAPAGGAGKIVSGEGVASALQTLVRRWAQAGVAGEAGSGTVGGRLLWPELVAKGRRRAGDTSAELVGSIEGHATLLLARGTAPRLGASEDRATELVAVGSLSICGLPHHAI
jgi:hypothetical protein